MPCLCHHPPPATCHHYKDENKSRIFDSLNNSPLKPYNKGATLHYLHFIHFTTTFLQRNLVSLPSDLKNNSKQIRKCTQTLTHTNRFTPEPHLDIKDSSSLQVVVHGVPGIPVQRHIIKQHKLVPLACMCAFSPEHILRLTSHHQALYLTKPVHLNFHVLVLQDITIVVTPKHKLSQQPITHLGQPSTSLRRRLRSSIFLVGPPPPSPCP
ncbi:hypothetical protein E2C01_004904 [Portunus trituberculatus]|uniref:Uncharacterized protein n=1 Tax=Portunus trituberculatus TaxID=210409 RepID=A0A5B7CSK8_PORTR|nr:hypothetical protein [Portunus trituberculatus]